LKPQRNARACAGLVVVAPPCFSRPPPTPPSRASSRNCKAVDAVDSHGIAKNFKAVKTADGLTGRPFVSTKLYLAQPRTLDRGKDGVACET
jgi:hypothetical protein